MGKIDEVGWERLKRVVTQSEAARSIRKCPLVSALGKSRMVEWNSRNRNSPDELFAKSPCKIIGYLVHPPVAEVERV